MAAIAFAIFAYALFAISCDENCAGHSAGSTWQLVIAIVAAVTVCAAAIASRWKRRTLTIVLAAAAVALYVTWAVVVVATSG